MNHTNAIARSISHDEIVTVHVGPEDTMEGALAQLTSDPSMVADYDWVSVESTLWDVWGTTADGEEWRVYLRKVHPTHYAVSANGTTFGTYPAASEQEARDLCAQDAGYLDEADMVKRLGEPSDLIAVLA
jgi:hypothetical protein